MNAQAEETRTLLPLHRKDLHKSGLNDETIKAAGFYSATREEAKELLEFDPRSGGWVIPYPDRNELPELINFKPDIPFEGENGKKRKYLRPKGSQSRVYIPAITITSMEAMQSKGSTLFIVEGEKKTLKGAQEGLVCIGLSGVWNWKFRDELGDSRTIPDLRDVWLKGRKVVICFDSDIATNWMVAQAEYKLAEKLRSLGAIVSGVRLPSGPNNNKVGLDDYLLDHSIEAFRALPTVSLEDQPALTVEEWLESAKDKDREEKPELADLIPVLAKMDPLSYDRVRAKVAGASGIRVSTLDTEVDKLRPQAKDAKGLTFEDSSPWEDEVNGGQLLEEITFLIKKYILMGKGEAEAVAAWCVATWFSEVFYFAPILSLLSATKRCGKSNLLSLINLLVYRGSLTSGAGITPAVLFRVNDEYHPTWLIDEAEKLSGDDGAKDLIGLLNEGYKRGGNAFRCDPKTHKPVAYDPFGYRAIASIRPPWDTIFDRSITIKMTRKTKRSKVERFAARRVDHEGKILARKIARWAEDNREPVSEAEPATPRPGWLNDRACDNWSPLFAVGTIAGDSWLELLLDSAKVLSNNADENDSLGELLIRDIKSIFDTEATSDGEPVQFISSSSLRRSLNTIEESPWGTMRRTSSKSADGSITTEEDNTTGLSACKLSKMLKSFGIKSRHTKKGNVYKFEDFIDVFSSYVPTEGHENPSQPSHQTQDIDFSEGNDEVLEKSDSSPPFTSSPVPSSVKASILHPSPKDSPFSFKNSYSYEEGEGVKDEMGGIEKEQIKTDLSPKELDLEVSI